LKGYIVAKDYVSQKAISSNDMTAVELAKKKRNEIRMGTLGSLEEKDLPLLDLLIYKIERILTSRNEEEFNESVIKHYNIKASVA
jgi:hypothetical protein